MCPFLKSNTPLQATDDGRLQDFCPFWTENPLNPKIKTLGQGLFNALLLRVSLTPKVTMPACNVLGIINVPLNALVQYSLRVDGTFSATSQNDCAHAVFDFLKRIDSSASYAIVENSNRSFKIVSTERHKQNSLHIKLAD